MTNSLVGREVSITESVSVWAVDKEGEVWIDFDEMVTSIGLSREKQRDFVRSRSLYMSRMKQIECKQGGKVVTKWFMNQDVLVSYVHQIADMEVSSNIRGTLRDFQENCNRVLNREFFGAASQVAATEHSIDLASSRMSDRMREIMRLQTLELADHSEKIEYHDRQIGNLSQRQDDLSNQVRSVAANYSHHEQWHSVKGWFLFNDLRVPDLETCKTIGRVCSQACRLEGVKIRKVSNEDHGKHNVYPDAIVERVVSEMGLR